MAASAAPSGRWQVARQPTPRARALRGSSTTSSYPGPTAATNYPAEQLTPAASGGTADASSSSTTSSSSRESVAATAAIAAASPSLHLSLGLPTVMTVSAHPYLLVNEGVSVAPELIQFLLLKGESRCSSSSFLVTDDGAAPAASLGLDLNLLTWPAEVTA